MCVIVCLALRYYYYILHAISAIQETPYREAEGAYGIKKQQPNFKPTFWRAQNKLLVGINEGIEEIECDLK